MKKCVLILAVLICTMFLSAQAEHLKFMGIPLTGTITQFQQKLAAKGITYNKRISQAAPLGTRCFNGEFFGSRAYFVVWYDTDTKIVYGARAVLYFDNQSERDDKYEEMKPMLIQKYAEDELQENTKDGLEALQITVTDEEGNECLGYINLYRTEEDYGDIYHLHVQYLDHANFNENQKSLMNDL